MCIPGKQSIIADILSRAYISDSTQEIKASEMEKYIRTRQKPNIQWVTINSMYIEAKRLKTKHYKC